MKKTVLTTSLAAATVMVLTGCTAPSMPSPETMKQISVQEFLEGQGFSWDDKSKLYEIHATKNRAFDKYGNWTEDFKEFYDKRFNQYCTAKGGKIENSDAWQNRVFPTKSDKTDIMISGKLIDNIKNWEKIDKLCTVNDTPIFGYYIGNKYIDTTNHGTNFWWNIDAFALPINLKDYKVAFLLISSYLKHNNSEKSKKASSPATQTDKNYPTSSSGFRRY